MPRINVLTPPTNPNSFGGHNTDMVQPLKSGAGWYIGRLYFDEDMGDYFPWCRDSYGYYSTREAAVVELKSNLAFYLEEEPDESTQNHIDEPDTTDFYLT